MTSAEDPSGRVPVFVDASVWVAAASSPTGGSSLVLDVCRGRRFAAVCSQRALLEAQHNIRAKMTTGAMARFYELLAAVLPALTAPEVEAEAGFVDLVGPGDAHVVAAAVRAGAAFLITLDRKHLVNERVRAAGLPFQILTPGEFIRQVLAERPAP